MKIGIIGYGFVGKAIEAGMKDDVEVIKIDPKLDTQIKIALGLKSIRSLIFVFNFGSIFRRLTSSLRAARALPTKP
jgi:hypothetical protein